MTKTFFHIFLSRPCLVAHPFFHHIFHRIFHRFFTAFFTRVSWWLNLFITTYFTVFFTTSPGASGAPRESQGAWGSQGDPWDVLWEPSPVWPREAGRTWGSQVVLRSPVEPREPKEPEKGRST